MSTSFFFYDLETSGRNARAARVMQFAGQRTDMALQPIGEPVNILIKLTPDTLPEPEAILLTGITPQQSIAEGISEAEFLKIFEAEVATPDTIFAGFNSIRFDDEFMRFMRYRNFYDPYDWQWKDGRSRWDLLDMTRMTRALRPAGIEWPFGDDGKPTNRLELITKLNGLDHEHAHDALNDVMATIALAELIRSKQPKLFDFLLQNRGKKQVEAIVNAGQPFVYTSGKYPNEFEKTAVVAKLTADIGKQGAVVYDLHFDPAEFTALNARELADMWKWQIDPDAKKLPVKTIKYNRCPAVAPLGVLDAASQQRIKLDSKTYETNLKKLRDAKDFPDKLREAQALMERERQAEFQSRETTVDEQLYDGFLADQDGQLLPAVRAAEPEQLPGFTAKLHDTRLRQLLPLYKARNYPASLSAEEREAWDGFCACRLFDGGDNSLLAKYFQQLTNCAADPKYSAKQFLLEELQLYGQSLLPAGE